MQLGIWAVVTLNQLIIAESYTVNEFSKKQK